MPFEVNNSLLATLKQPPFLFQKCGHNKTAWQCTNWNKLQKYVTKVVGFFIIFVENIVQSCWNEQGFVHILKQRAFFVFKFADQEIL